MEKVGSINTDTKDLNIKETMFIYSEDEKQENEINKANAKLIYNPKFIPVYPQLLETLTAIETMLYGFIDFYKSSSSERMYFTNKDFAKILKCSEDSISKSLKKLRLAIRKKKTINSYICKNTTANLLEFENYMKLFVRAEEGKNSLEYDLAVVSQGSFLFCENIIMETPNYYAVIPANVRYAKINANAKLLYGEITALCNKEGYCWATNNYFSELYDVHKDTVSSWITELVKHGFIILDINKKNGNKRKIYLSIKLPIPMDENTYTPMGENTPTLNSTSNSNKNKEKEISKIVKKPTAQYTSAFEKIWSSFPEARSGNKKEAYEEFQKNWSYEEVIDHIQILKWEIKVGIQEKKYLPAMQRRLKNLSKLTEAKRKEKLDQIGFILMEGMHESGDKTETKLFGVDFTNEYCMEMGRRRYKQRNQKNLQSFR